MPSDTEQAKVLTTTLWLVRPLLCIKLQRQAYGASVHAHPQQYVITDLQCVSFCPGRSVYLPNLPNENYYKVFCRRHPIQIIQTTIFTALHAMQTRSSDEKAVRLSVCQTRAL